MKASHSDRASDPESSSQQVRVEASGLRKFAARLLNETGVQKTDAESIAEVLVEADLRGVDSHGVTRLAGYIQLMETERVNPRPDIRCLKDSGTTLLFDGDRGVGIPAARHAMDTVIKRAEEGGMACASLRNISHTGMIGWYTMRAARRGMIGIAMNNGPCMVPPFGGKDPFLATNPISIAAPGSSQPVVLDMATTVVAAGKIRLAEKRGGTIPDSWALDREGVPTTDPTEAIQRGFFQWTGGYKGFGLALMVEIMTGVLSGGLFGQDVPGMVEFGRDPLVSHGFYAAIKIDRFMPLSNFHKRVDELVAQAHGSRRSVSENPVLVAGEKESLCRLERLEKGIPLSRNVFTELENLGKSRGIAMATMVCSSV